jgi:hypothetical protein
MRVITFVSIKPFLDGFRCLFLRHNCCCLLNIGCMQSGVRSDLANDKAELNRGSEASFGITKGYNFSVNVRDYHNE